MSRPARHGTEAGYRRHRAAGEKACWRCRAAANKANREREAAKLAAEIELTGGAWVPRGGILVWQPTQKTEPTQPAAECGTDSGYYRHRRVTKDQPCIPCRAAHSRAKSERRRKRLGIAA